MGQDLRKLFDDERKKTGHEMKTGHEKRFLKLLESEMPLTRKTKPLYYQWSVAASIALLICVGGYFFLKNSKEIVQPNPILINTQSENEVKNIGLGDLSPDLKKVEEYYVSHINFQLAQLKVSDDNKELVDGYMEQLIQLDKDYQYLIKDLNEQGPSDATVEALIQNLQLRLGLLQKLKQKMNLLKSNENEPENQVV